MQAKSTRVSVATVAVALITGLVVALWVALMPAPAQAQQGEILHLQTIKVVDYQDRWPDNGDEPYIDIYGERVWSATSGGASSMGNGDVRRIDVSVPIREASVPVQLWERDGGRGHPTIPDTLLGEFAAGYTDGTMKTQSFTVANDYDYEITYVVDRPATPTNTNPEILDLNPAPGSEIKELKPLISATVRDAETDLSASNIKLFVDGNAKTFVYDKARDKLTYQSDAELVEGQHTVRIEATDEKGLKDTKEWSFRIVKTAPENPSSHNTAPGIGDLRPAPGSKIKNRAPLISATVRDAETDLSASNIKLFVDGSERTTSYDTLNHKLTYQSAKLARGRHTVKVEATDASGLKGENTWSFKVVKRVKR